MEQVQLKYLDSKDKRLLVGLWLVTGEVGYFVDEWLHNKKFPCLFQN